MATIRDLVDEPTTSSALQRSIERLNTCLRDDGPLVTWLCAGANRADILQAFADDAADARVIRIDCRGVEPTHTGLALELGSSESTLKDVASAISNSANRPIVLFDHYEVFRLADGWLRRDFIPDLGTNARVVFVSNESPSAGWVAAAGWRPYFNIVDARESEDGADFAASVLEQANDESVREVLQAASVVRRITKPMLAAICPEADSDTAWNALRKLSFVEQDRDGLALDGSVQDALGTELRAADPDRYRTIQRQAWSLLRRQLKSAARADLWRTTADIIFLIENPVIREAFFPSASALYSVEPSSRSDFEEIVELVEQHENMASVDAMRIWWKHLPTAFHTVRDSNNATVGFYCAARPDEIDRTWMRFDPVADAWLRHLDSKAAPSLFLRRWLSAEDGERPSGVQAAAWVDVKRTYLELRPELRRVYLAVEDLEPYAAVATELGFTVLEDSTVEIDGQQRFSAMLDFGPGSVDGWIANLVAAELGIVEDQLLDATTHELLLGGGRIALTPLEYGVVSMLESREGEGVSREALLEQVWGRNHDGSSNVVDAVVRGLRKKCGENAEIFETVRGVGYRLRREV